MKKKHYMVDIETLGTGHFACIIAIGAVLFDPNALSEVEGGEFGSRFYVAIDPIDACKRGLRMDASTVMWWMQPDQREAWDQWTKITKFPLDAGLEGLKMWMDENDKADPPDPEVPEASDGYPVKHRVVWGNGATFDNMLLRDAYEAVGTPVPWGYRGDVCFRTMRALSKSKPPEFIGTLHKADDDAAMQARWMQQIVKELNITL